MTVFKARIGDLFASDAQTLVNTVNCVGIMGKGVAAEFKKRFPGMMVDYTERCARGEVRLGEPYLYTDLTGARIVNFPTKGHWRSTSRLSDVESGLRYLAAHADEWGITSLAMPPLGCGNGGLAWTEIGPLIHRELHGLPCDIEVFAPYGTPPGELTPAFLAGPAQLSMIDRGARAAKLNPAWLTLMEVLRDLQAQPYASLVGRTIFQKIAYVLTGLGVPTGFAFRKGDYGPFSGDLKKALHDFANRNWLQEARLGNLIPLTVQDQYDKDRRKFAAEIDIYRKEIERTVDLFSRIRSTDQAEEVATVLYAARTVKAREPAGRATELDVMGYVLDWKPAWQADDKRASVAETIRSLVLLNWVRADISDALPVA